jgi:hypothetical protein
MAAKIISKFSVEPLTCTVKSNDNVNSLTCRNIVQLEEEKLYLKHCLLCSKLWQYLEYPQTPILETYT